MNHSTSHLNPVDVGLASPAVNWLSSRETPRTENPGTVLLIANWPDAHLFSDIFRHFHLTRFHFLNASHFQNFLLQLNFPGIVLPILISLRSRHPVRLRTTSC